jgi:hypothetical protein
MKSSALKYRRNVKEMVPAPIDRKWGRIWDAAERTGLSKSEIYKLLNDPNSGVESFVYKSSSSNKTGARLINLVSLDACLDKLSAESRKKGSSE